MITAKCVYLTYVNKICTLKKPWVSGGICPKQFLNFISFVKWQKIQAILSIYFQGEFINKKIHSISLSRLFIYFYFSTKGSHQFIYLLISLLKMVGQKSHIWDLVVIYSILESALFSFFSQNKWKKVERETLNST